MGKKSFFAKLDIPLLALTAVFLLTLYAGRVTAEPVAQTETYTVRTQRGIAERIIPTEQEKVNINTATEEELQTLHGIGEVKARAIVEYREANGLFSSAEDLLNVYGIGEKTLEEIKDNITWEVAHENLSGR